MGVSFKISKTGRRFRPKHPPQAPVSIAEDGDNPDDVVSDGIPKKLQDGIAKAENLTGLLSNTRAREHVSPDQEASFVVVLLPDGFFVEKPSEVIKLQNILQDRPTSRLLPYNRDSENLFSAIESGWVPGELLDDIPCKYFNGALVCEVRDYRKCMPEQGAKISSMDDVPIINKVLLRMSLENIVKDMPSISDDSWTYGDRMEVESRVLKALQPKLCLDPIPMLDRVCSNTVSDKLNLGICGFKRRLKTDFSVECNNQAHGKKACTDRVPENANYESANLRTISGDATMQRPHEATLRSKGFLQEASIPTVPSTSQSHYQAPGSHPRVNRDSLSVSAASLPGIATQNQLQNTISSYTDLVGGNMHGKRDAQEMQFANIPGTKRSKQTAVTQDTNQHLPGLRTEGPTGGDMQWKSAMLREQLDPKGIHYSMAINSQRAPIMNDIPNMEGGGSFYSNQQGIRFGIKQEQTENEKLDRQESDRFKPVLKVAETDTSQLNAQQLRQHQLSQQAFIRSQFTHQQWNNLSSPSDNGRKDEMPSKNSKKSQSPRISAGTMVQSPVSSKSGDISAVSFLGSHKEKTPAISSAAVGTPSVTSSPSDSMQRNSQGPAKGKKGSIPKAPSMSGVGSPASVGNVSAAPLSANSPSVVTAPMGIADSYILERLSKIEMISQRYQLNNKKNKVESFNSVKQTAFSSQEVSYYLSNSMNAEDLTDPARPMSKSIMGGTMNNCKTRILNCVRSSVYQGNNTVGPARIRNRLIMTERPADGTVVMQYGDMDETDVPSTQDCLLTLPTTLYADLLAAQFVELMKHDGFDMIDDQIRPIAPRMSLACSNPLSAGMPPDSVVPEGQHVDGNSSQHPNAAAQVNSNSSMGNLNSNQNTSNSTRMMPPGNVSQGYLPSGQNLALPARTQQMEQTILQHQQSQQQQQQMQSQLQQQQPQLQNQPSQIQQQQPQPHQQLQHPQIHRSGINPLSHLIGHNSNLQMSGNQMVNKPTQLQLQALQQGQLRKSMIGLGAPMNLGNNMMGGLGGLSNVIMRGISSPVPPIQNLTNITQNQMNLAAANFGVGFRPGSLPNAQATALAKMRMATQAQNRGNLFAGQSGMAGLPGNSNQMLPSSMGLSMLGQTLNRPNVNQLQRASVASMGPPKIPGTNIYMNPQQLQMQQQQIQQQQQQQQHLHHHQQQMPQQEQQQQQQQQISSPLQQSQVSSPSIVGSPPGMPMQQLQISPQQMSQQTAISPQQLSAGALQQMNTASTAGPGPASPQLSSQTHGSVGSISSSPMDHLHGANKGSSVNTG